MKKTTALGSDKLENILSAYPEINPEWLLTGMGDMQKLPALGSVNAVRNRVVGGNNCHGQHDSIPLVDLLTVDGFGKRSFSIKEADVNEYYTIPKFRDSQIDFMIEVAGNVMYPRYASGDVIACKIIHESRFIQWGRVYLIDTKSQSLLIKRLYPCKDNNKECYECHSDNTEYPPFEIRKQEVTGLALVVGLIGLE